MLGYKKGNKKLLTGQIPLHYPADRVYLDGDTTKSVQDAVDHQEAMIATVQPNLTAVKAYAKNEQFVYNGLLYKATAVISSGGTITIGGNCELSPKVTEQIGTINGTLGNMVFTEVTGITMGTGITNAAIYKATIGDHVFFRGSFRVSTAKTSGDAIMSGVGVNGGGAGVASSPYSSGGAITYINGAVLTNASLAVSSNPYWFFAIV